ncbi:hypothetical protein ACFOEZ_10080 [Tianweitania populi]|uniref:DUF1090 family protein n=1 Tax=Tianweitania populi TaxID=1607949 RepID=A0A8J3DTT8_9HYPH|nr:hypothetical protein [Tianweitania populi]GHD24450.1 hypothetical protein GCM10016234_40670 [Tianweitania populi]
MRQQLARHCAVRGKSALAVILLFAAPGLGFAQDEDRSTLPKDVRAFMERRDECDHFRNEEAYDEARGVEIEKGVAKFCTGTDAELESLRQRHRRDPAVTKALSSYEADIE